ncbi:hypothetical protein C8F04DRAFT_1117012 [Mycena alexandri]|uniref:Uncharacterized protein n=1 Tax=Mycena alexandri TaxID=1745969 RepID=A0AAD6SKE2_9AGAR|nr:hypothetical protein C8F04DRAFT_1117012 [Mycena alexandri]
MKVPNFLGAAHGQSASMRQRPGENSCDGCLKYPCGSGLCYSLAPNRLPKRAGKRQIMSAQTLNEASNEESIRHPGPAPPWNPKRNALRPDIDISLHAHLVLQPSFSDCLEYMGVTDLQRRRVPQHFIIYALTTALRQQSDSRLYEFLNWVKRLYEQELDFATSFSNYRTILEVVFRFLNRIVWSWEERRTGDIAKQIFEHLSLDAYTLLAEFIIVLRDTETYKTFLASRGPVAQRLLDLVQDVGGRGIH